MRPETALAPLASQSHLAVRQTKEWLEVFTDFEGRNRYQVAGADGRVLYVAGEVGGGLGLFLLRSFLKAKRPFTLALATPAGERALTLRRPFRFWLSRLTVEDAQGRVIGSVRQRFRFFTRAYDVLDAGGNVVASLEGPFFKPWTFHILAGGREVGRVAKRWSGFGKELFTDADNFGVQLGPALAADVRPLVLAAVFLVDFVHFENRE